MAAVDYFLQISGIDGESTDNAFKKAIEPLSFSWGASNAASITSAKGGLVQAGRASWSEFTFTKHVDVASPKLMINLAKGTHLDKVTLSGRKAGGGVVFLKYVLSGVLVTAYQVDASSEDPIESVSFAYSKIDYSYTSVTKEGGTGTTTTAGWDQGTNTAS